jgi:DNA-binding NarL/FixJ family response regulator
MISRNTHPIRVLIVDDSIIVREGLMAIINGEADMSVVGEAADGPQAVELFRQQRPDLMLTDLRLPIMNGVEVSSAILKEFREGRIIVLTDYAGNEDIYRALKAGARSYLLKSTTRKELLETIRAVHAGHFLLPSQVAARLAERVGNSHLTIREHEVLELIVRGGSNKEIAAALAITEGTVKGHVNSILSKMGVSDRTQAATTALRRGIVHLN